ncbi:MAG: cyclase family protein [Pseudomonadota bacterium]
MCDACVIKSVKRRMLNRRELFVGAASAAVATGVAGVPIPALAQPSRNVVDMTHVLSTEFPTFSGVPGISYDKRVDFKEDGYNLYILSINEHTGTHIDAPLHFSEDGKSVAEIPVNDLVGPLCVVNIRGKASDNPDAQLTPDDLEAWIDRNGPIPDGAVVAMNSGWSEKVGTDGFRNADTAGDGLMHFPGFHVEAVQMLLDETNASAIAVDTLSLDYGQSKDFATHYTWLPAGRYGIECLAALDQMPEIGATIVVGAPKVKDGTGGPARIMAFV